PGQITYPVASLTLDSARSYVMQGAPFTKKDTTEILEFKTSKDRYGDNEVSDPIKGLVFKGTGSLPNGRGMIPNELSNSVKIDLSKGYSGGGVVDLTGDEDPTDEDGDIEMGDST
ncbi:hypothetical protein Tco_0612365, partial [Tanacetum coccineum]